MLFIKISSKKSSSVFFLFWYPNHEWTQYLTSIKKECEHPWVDYLNTWITPWPIAYYIHRFHSCHQCLTCWICESFIHPTKRQKNG